MANVIEENKNKLQLIVDAIAQDPSFDKRTKVNLIIHSTSLICAIVAVQPIPFADIFVLTPIQLVMVTALNKVLGNPFEKSSLKEILTSLIGVVGWGTLAQHTILGLYKTVIPFLGAVTTIPLVYASTFALGTGAKILIESKKADRSISDADIKKLMEEAKKKAQNENKNLNPADALSQVTQLFNNATEYNNYKKELLFLQERIDDVYSSEENDNISIQSYVSSSKNKIATRLTKYKNLYVNDYFVSLFSVMDSKTFIEQVEPILGEINFNLHNQKIVNTIRKANYTIFEIETEIGYITVKEGFLKELIAIDLYDEFKANSILEYMSVKATNELFKDAEIRNEFHRAIRNAEKYIYIISPWANDAVRRDLLPLMKKQIALHPELKIKVLYGIDDKVSNNKRQVNNQNKNEESRRVLMKYKEELGYNFDFKRTNTHVKLVLSDDRYCLDGSMNYLSFNGIYNEYDSEAVRHEIAHLTNDAAVISDYKETYFNW